MAPELDTSAVSAWLDRVYTNAPGLVAVSHQDRHGLFRGSSGVHAGPDTLLAQVRELDAAGARSLYLRTTTLATRPQSGARGSAADSHALPGLWADVDFGTDGHKPGPGLPLPPDATKAWSVVTTSGLPEPSLWVHSGGGLYPWWLLEQPLLIDDDNRQSVTDLSAQWQQALGRSAERLGYSYGTGVGDLSRVLRLPGTINRKTDTPRPCQVVEDTGQTYAFPELLQAVMDLPAAPAPTQAPRTTAPAPRRPDAQGVPHHNMSAFDQLDAHATFGDVLTGAGWTPCQQRTHPPAIDQCWTRPGDPDNPCSAHTLTARPEVLVVHSELAGLPTGGGQKLTRGRLFAHLHHHGDERAAALDLFAAIGGRPASSAAQALPLPRETRPLTDTPQDITRADLVGLEPPLQEEPPEPPAQEQEPPPFGFDFHTIAELRARVTARGKRRWLLRGLWPAGDYGVFGAEKKAQKTWAAVDMAVSVASGTPWLGLIEVDAPGPVLLFVGEGGEGNTLRRIDAAAEEHAVDPDGLPIRVCARVPHLSNSQHIALLDAEVDQHQPALVIIDPFYLAARGGELGDLFRQGAMLEDVQRACQQHHAALLIVHHFNRGQGSGAGRLSGAGPAEWGRVLITAEKKSARTDPDTRATDVITHLEAVGGEIPDQTLRVHRKVWSDDPDDLDSPLHTTTQAHWSDDETADMDSLSGGGDGASPAARKLLEAMDALGEPGTSAQLVDHVVNNHGHGLTRETVSRELNKLLKAGIVDMAEDNGGPGRWPTKHWWRVQIGAA